MKPEIEILYSNPVSKHSHPERLAQPSEASLASSSEMAARSVDSELQSHVIEPRNCRYRWSLRAVNSGDNTEAPKSRIGAWSGVEVRPGSKSLAEQYWGLLGRWESLLFPWLRAGRGETDVSTSMLISKALREIREKQTKRTKVSISEGDRAMEMNKGSLSLRIVAIESRGTHPMDPVTSKGRGRVMDA